MSHFEHTEVANPNQRPAAEITLSSKAMDESFQSRVGKPAAGSSSEGLGEKTSHLDCIPIKGYDAPASGHEVKAGPGNAHSVKGAGGDTPNSKKS